jgi:nitrile hydratase
MNGGQDLGGMMGFGAVIPEPEDELFHAEWERTAFSLTLAMGALGRWGIDASRHARESLHPMDYLGLSYYEIWLKGLEKLMLADGLVTEAEMSLGHAQGEGVPLRAVEAAEVPPMLARGTRYDRDPLAPTSFAVGDVVLTSNDHPMGHTRLPRYARGKRGVVERVIGYFVFPDTAAMGLGDQPQWVYTVTFDASALWGRDADPSLTVSIDAWESYLERV